jgi:hypothetical protein
MVAYTPIENCVKCGVKLAFDRQWVGRCHKHPFTITGKPKRKKK